MAIRSCAVCRQKSDKWRMLRFVRVGDDNPNTGGKTAGEASILWVLDPEGVLPGRGQYVHAESRCLKSPKLVRVFSHLGDDSIETLLRKSLGRIPKRKNGKNAFSLVLNERETLKGEAAVRKLCELLKIRTESVESPPNGTKRKTTAKVGIRL